MRKALTALVPTLVLGIGVSQAAASTVIYQSTVPAPGNLPSVGFEASQVSEFGDAVAFPSGGPRIVRTVKVQLSSWACQDGNWFSSNCFSAPRSTFSVPITLNLYSPNSVNPDLPGPLIQSFTQSFDVPYRPTANLTHCHGTDAGEWWSGSLGKCFNGKVATITFKVGGLGIQLPDSIIAGVAYNTTHYGYSPIGESAACFGTAAGCPYDSLNFGLSPAVSIGSQVNPGTVFQNATQSSDYCDGTPTPGIFNLDSPTSACWGAGPYIPAIQISAS